MITIITILTVLIIITTNIYYIASVASKQTGLPVAIAQVRSPMPAGRGQCCS